LKSSYIIVPRILNPVIDAGETIIIEIYISGSGHIEKNKMNVNMPSKQLVDLQNPGTIYSDISLLQEIATGKTQALRGKNIPVESRVPPHKLDGYGVTIVINDAYFFETGSLGKNYAKGLAAIEAEKLHDKMAPFVLEINTSRKARRGDYGIDISFTYSDGAEMATDHKVVNVHITDWVEKYSKWLEIIGLGAALATIIGLLALYGAQFNLIFEQNPSPPLNTGAILIE
jgi:hypothetical protein